MSRTESNPRRWPDLLIGLLVLLLLAGFASLLLGQRRSQVAQAPATPVTEPAPMPESPSADIPAAPGTDLTPDNNGATAPAASTPPAGTSGTDQGNTASSQPDTSAPASQPDDSAQTPSPAATSPATAPAAAPRTDTASSSSPATKPEETPTPGTTVPSSNAPTSSGVPVVPAESIPAAPAAPPAPAVTLTPPPVNPAATAPEQPAAPPRAGGAVATSEQRMPLRSDYRISLGTFASADAAQSRTQGVRDLGYTIYPIDVGNQVVAQVGPFADEATARQALSDIHRVYPRALLYAPRHRTLTENSESGSSGGSDTNGTASEPDRTAAPASPAPTTPAPSEATAPAAASPAPAPSGPVYLQVGAFDRVESAQTLVGQLREQGYAPTVNAPEGRKVTVLIGPFSGAALTSAEEKLDANGFDHFRVR
ncbi:SPOR domain-containing protein [Deinococcus aluminii]|uniref:SPOR domain-containing protein n=1 Tax=Deinococcus aluminii TaxID=1656885 RepID=A0ABP9XDH5_9DEIO